MKTLVKVHSSAINQVEYDEESRILTVQFKQGTNYDYYNVPLKEFESLVSAPSVGQYFNQHIKQYSANFIR